jgi:hypothetical protein
MKKVVLISILFLCIVTCANTGQENGKFAATLPNGATVELIGVSYLSQGLSQPKRWWRPDGTDMIDEPFRHSTTSTGGSSGYKVRDFALYITGVDDYSSASYNSLGRTNVQPVIPVDKENKFLPGVLAFVGLFEEGRFEDTIRIGVSTESWQKVEEWIDEGWHEHDPDNIVFAKSTNPLILTWPRQKGEAVILEMVSKDVAEAKRMLLFDRNGRIHEEHPRILGQGLGLVKEQYWFWHIQREDMHRIEFQKRPYQWVEFRNVSLEPTHKTNVEIDVLSTKGKLARGLNVSEHEKESLGYILDKLTNNLKFPSKGRAVYKLEELDAPALGQEPRVLECKYSFDGVCYRFETVTIEPGTTLRSLDICRYFDGDKTTMMFRDNAADIWKGKRKQTPIYRLQRFCPGEIIEELLNHEVELKGSCEINGVLCSLLNCIISSKDRLKVWVAKEPDIYPLRIERYEYDNMRYLYQAENIRYWNGFFCPEKITTQWYRSDEAVQHIPLSSYAVTVESFSPNIELAADEFAPEFAPDTSVSTHVLAEPQASDFKPTIPAKHLRKFADIDIEFDIGQAQDKIMLVCFFDTNQRPSRNCILQLSKRAQELKTKDVSVIAVQASKVGKNNLDEWVKKNDIPFPVGIIRGDEQKTRSNWGVKSLPWLILTDSKHIVSSEGFGLEELEDKIKAANE